MMTTKEMIEELEAAGMSISDDTSDEQIEELYTELQVEQASGEPELAQEEETLLTETFPEKPTVCPITPNPRFGDKDPDVIAWYKANDRDEYERRYAGRVIPV